MQRNRRDIETCNPHILHNQSICTGIIKPMDHPFCIRQLLVSKDRIQSNVNLYIIYMSKVTQRTDVVERITGRRTCAELRRTDIYGIGPVKHSLLPTVQVFGRRKAVEFIRRALVDIVVQPVGKQQVRMPAPTHQGGLRRIVVRIITDRLFNR